MSKLVTVTPKANFTVTISVYRLLWLKKIAWHFINKKSRLPHSANTLYVNRLICTMLISGNATKRHYLSFWRSRKPIKYIPLNCSLRACGWVNILISVVIYFMAITTSIDFYFLYPRTPTLSINF